VLTEGEGDGLLEVDADSVLLGEVPTELLVQAASMVTAMARADPARARCMAERRVMGEVTRRIVRADPRIPAQEPSLLPRNTE